MTKSLSLTASIGFTGASISKNLARLPNPIKLGGTFILYLAASTGVPANAPAPKVNFIFLNIVF